MFMVIKGFMLFRLCNLIYLITFIFLFNLNIVHNCLSMWIPQDWCHHFVSLQKKAADAFSMFGSDIYKHGKMNTFQVAASESKSDSKTD